MTNSEYLDQRFQALLRRLDETYDGIGHSSGRPYLYFVYPPESELYVRRLVSEQMQDYVDLAFVVVDMIAITSDSLSGQEERRVELLNDPDKGAGAAKSIMRKWARDLGKRIISDLGSSPASKRPVVVLVGLAALHPLGNPTSLMEAVAESEYRNPATGQLVPIVLLVPGTHPPQASRTYHFLGLDDQRLSFYRGEEL